MSDITIEVYPGTTPAQLDAAQAAAEATAAAALAAHAAASDPHPAYTTAAELASALSAYATSSSVTSAISTHASATDPHGDRAAATTALAQATSANAANTGRLLRKLYRGVEDASVLVLSDSTGDDATEWVYLWATAFAARFPAYTVTYRLWSDGSGAYGSPTTLQTGSGAQTLAVYNCAVAGTATEYTLAGRWAAAVVAPDPDLVMISYGHNEGPAASGYTAAHWRGRYLALTESLTLEHPNAGLLCVLQNPQPANDDQAKRARVYEEIAGLRGYGTINVHDAFVATGNVSSLLTDGTHPNTTGSALWRDTVLAAFNYTAAAPSRPQGPSTFATAVEQACPNGLFADFASSVPDNWTLYGCTASKDTRSGWYESANGYAVRLQASGSTSSFIRQSISTYARYKGKWITLAVRMRIPTSGNGAGAGRIGIEDGVTDLSSKAPYFARDGFFWHVLSLKVSTSATMLRVTVYGDTSANATADITIDRICLVPGAVPRDTFVIPSALSVTDQATNAHLDYVSTLGNHPGVAAGAAAANVVGLSTANNGLFIRVKAPRNMTITRLRWIASTASGNYDIGIYDSSGTKLWSKGSTTWPASQLVTETVSPAVALTAGQEYRIAFAGDNITGKFIGPSAAFSASDMMKLATGVEMCHAVSTVFPLPSSVAYGSVGSSKYPWVQLGEA